MYLAVVAERPGGVLTEHVVRKAAARVATPVAREVTAPRALLHPLLDHIHPRQEVVGYRLLPAVEPEVVAVDQRLPVAEPEVVAVDHVQAADPAAADDDNSHETN